MKKLALPIVAIAGIILLVALFTSLKSEKLPPTVNVAEEVGGRSPSAKPKATGQPYESPSSSQVHAEQQSQASTAGGPQQHQNSDSNDKFKRMSVEEEASKVEQAYPAALNRRGFTEHEVEVIVSLQIEELKSPVRTKNSAIDKASMELGLSKEKKNLLNEAFDEVFVGGLVQYTTEDVAACMSKRLKDISACTSSVLEDYLKDLTLALDSDVFEINPKVGELTRAATKKAIETCKETPERANYQFKLVFVECDPI